VHITFVGHATVLIEINGQRVLTDPNLSEQVWGLRRKARPGVDIPALPELAAILISHAHYDHFDLPTLRRLDPAVPLILPRRTRGVAGRLPGRRLVELRHGEVWEQGTLRVTAVPARHFGGRWLVDSPLRPANGYVIEGPAGTAYFAGDTASPNPFAEIGRRFRLDAALLPIGAYRPAWVMRWSHLSPSQALEAFQTLNARVMIPIHWGSFRLSLEPMDEPVRRLRKLAEQAGLLDRIVVLNPGQSWSQG
jgi:L-ascorbate metabolism protein UlaG (beta-lactamase superfamily)